MNANNGDPDTGIGVTSDMGVHIMVYLRFSNNPGGRLLSHQLTSYLISVRSFCVRFISSVRTPLGLWCFSLKIAPFSISFNYRIPVHREIFRNIWWEIISLTYFSSWCDDVTRVWLIWNKACLCIYWVDFDTSFSWFVLMIFLHLKCFTSK